MGRLPLNPKTNLGLVSEYEIARIRDLSEKYRTHIGTAVYRAEGGDRFVLPFKSVLLQDNREQERLKCWVLAMSDA